MNHLPRRGIAPILLALAMLWLLGMTATVQAQINPYGPGASTLRVRITQQGFSPSSFQTYGPTDIFWTNNSGVTVVLRSGPPDDPDNPNRTMYLPLLNLQGGTQVAQVYPRANATTVDFAVELPPGASFMQRYSAPGDYQYHVVGGPNATGQLSVTGTGFLTSSPLNGESGVAPTRETIISFSGALNPATVTKNAFKAQVAGQDLDFRLYLSKDARQVTLFYTDPLPGNARVRVSIDGAILRAANGDPVDVDSDNLPGGLGVLEFTTLSLTLIPGTSVCGRVFASELATNGMTSVNTPLVNATITVDGRESELRATTNATGNFCLDPAPAGRFFVHIDGRTATNSLPAGSYYPFVGKTWDSVPGIESSIGDVYLPLVVPGTLQPVSQTEETVIRFAPEILQKFPQFEGVHITVPAGALFNDDGTPGGLAGIAPVPPDRIPGALPEELDFPMVITVQTDGAANFDQPAPVCFPNLPSPNTGKALEPGEKSALWSFNHDTGRFAVVGPMTASADGTLVCTDPGVGVPAPGWHSWNPGTPGRGGPLPRNPPPEDQDNDDEEEEEEEEECEEPGSGGTGSDSCFEKPNYAPSVNGCGPGFLDGSPVGPFWLVPLVLSGIKDDPMLTSASSCSFKAACDAHDVGYGTCNANKADVDTQFINDMRAACNSCYPNDGVNLAKCYASAEAYYQAVNYGGNTFYKAGQEEACECECETTVVAASPFLVHPSVEAGPASTQQEVADLSTGTHHYAIVNLATNAIQRGLAGNNGIAFENDLVLAPNTHYRIFVLSADTLKEGFTDLITPSPGESFVIPPIYMAYNYGYDYDDDLLGVAGEFVMNTDPLEADSDGDGVLDGAEVQQGTNPLDNVIVQTGIIASADTPGTATDVCLQGDLAVVADGSAGIAVFNAFGGMNPLILAQVPTPAAATTVACDTTHIVAATGSAGIAIVDIAAVTGGQVSRQVGFGSPQARSVAAANGIGYVGLSNGNVARVNLATGTVLGQLTVAPGRSIEDVALQGDYLYALTKGDLFTVILDGFTLGGSATFIYDSAGLGTRPRLALDNRRALITDEAGHTYMDIQLPGLPLRMLDTGSQNAGWRQLLATGTGLGLAVLDNDPFNDEATANVNLYDIRNPDNPAAFQAQFPTPGDAYAVTVHRGLAYVADGDAGLQVLNYLSADTQGITPTLTLESNFAPERAEANRPMRLTAWANDDVQVSEVEFYVDGELVARDGSYPFEHRFTTPDAPFTVRARAIDTGGNATWSPLQIRAIVADATIPLISTVFPPPRVLVDADTAAVSATFNEAMDPASLSAQSFLLLAAGNDGVLGTGDDQPLPNGVVNYHAGSRQAVLSFAQPLPTGSYRAVLTPAVRDAAGNHLTRAYTWDFNAITAGASVKLVPNERVQNSSFGAAIAQSGDWLAVGAPSLTVDDATFYGAVYLFRRDANSATGWTQFKRLIASDGGEFAQFGDEVALQGDTLIVSASRMRVDGFAQKGQVYVFMRNHGGTDNWGEVTRFSGAYNQFDYFGDSLALQGNTLVVGASGVDKTTIAYTGVAYIYTRTATSAADWTLVKEIQSAGTVDREFGVSVGIRSDEQRIVVGAPTAQVIGNYDRRGVVVVFDRDEGGPHNWGRVARLFAATDSPSRDLGSSVAIHGDLVVAGARFTQLGEDSSVGTLHIFTPDAGEESGWREVVAFHEAETAHTFRRLGSAVATNGDFIVAGAPGQWLDLEREVSVGTVYIYAAAPGQTPPWQRVALYTLLDAEEEVALGAPVILDGDTVIAAAPWTEGARGALYLFTLPDAP